MSSESPSASQDPDTNSPPDNTTPGSTKYSFYFSQEEPLSDLVLIVENKRLFTSRSLLGFASPVFKCMFTSEFKEKEQKEISLPGKSAKTVDEMLRQYELENLERAYNAVISGMSVYRACREYGVPESTLRDRTRGNVSLDANPGPDRLFSYEGEIQLVEHIKYIQQILDMHAMDTLVILLRHSSNSEG